MKFFCAVLLIAPLVLTLGCGESSDLSRTGQATEAQVSQDKSAGCAADCASTCGKPVDQACGSGSAQAFPHETLLTDFAGCCGSAQAGEKSDACCGGIALVEGEKSDACCGGIALVEGEKVGCCAAAKAGDAREAGCCAKCSCAPGACAKADGGNPCAERCTHTAADKDACKRAEECSKRCPKHGKQS